MKINGRYLMLALCLLVAGGCDDEKAEKAKKVAAEQASKAASEKKLMADPVLAVLELKRRLLNSVKLKDGLIIVDGQFGLQKFVLPADTSWVISCGIGMTVAFRTSASRGDSDVQIRLSWGIEKDDCDTLGVAVGKEIQTILAGH